MPERLARDGARLARDRAGDSEAIVEFGHRSRIEPHRASGFGCFGRRIGEKLRAQAILAVRRERRAIEHGVDEGIEFEPIGIRIALEEEGQDRIDDIAAALACSTVVAR